MNDDLFEKLIVGTRVQYRYPPFTCKYKGTVIEHSYNDFLARYQLTIKSDCGLEMSYYSDIYYSVKCLEMVKILSPLEDLAIADIEINFDYNRTSLDHNRTT